jgi:hypothetical protein
MLNMIGLINRACIETVKNDSVTDVLNLEIVQPWTFVQKLQKVHLQDMFKTKNTYIAKVAVETSKLERISCIDLNKPSRS